MIVVSTSEEMPRIIEALKNLDSAWIWAGTALIAFYLVLRAAALKYALYIQGERLSCVNAILVTGIGQFYSAITPSASGGQPMQVLALHRMGVSVPAATAAISMKYLGFQTAFSLIGIVLWISNAETVRVQLYGFRWLVVVGILINVLLGVILLMMSVNVGLVKRIVSAVTRLGKRLKFIKDENAAQSKAMGYIYEYRTALNNFKTRPFSAVVVLGLCIFQVLAYASVAYCIYKAFGVTGSTYTVVTTLQVLLFLSASFMPLPGAAGAQEGGFYIFFKGIFPDASIIPAMLCWRFFTYYLLMLAGLVAVVFDKVKKMLRDRRERKK